MTMSCGEVFPHRLVVAPDLSSDRLDTQPRAAKLVPARDLFGARRGHSRVDTSPSEMPHDRGAVVTVLIGEFVGGHA